MEEKFLLIISLICFFIGLSFLFYIYVTQDLELVQGLEVNLGSDVKIKGEVVSIDVRDGLTFLKVKRNVVDDVIFFEELDFFESDDVVIVGEVDKYNGKYEIIGKEISK